MRQQFVVKASNRDTIVNIDTLVTSEQDQDPNAPPVVNAGADKVVTLPVAGVVLDGSANDPDGSIVSILWQQISGKAVTISNQNTAKATVTGLSEGIYEFSMKATDNDGNSTVDQVVLTVKPEVVVNPGGTLIYNTGFETQADIQNDSNQLAQGSLSKTVFFSGAASFKSLVNTNPKSNISGGWRSEVQYPNNYTPNNRDITIQYMQRFEKLFTTDGLTGQFHGTASGTSGHCGLWISGSKFQVMRSVVAGVNMYQNVSSKPNIQLNKWYKIRWEVRFSANNDGYVRLFIDDQLYYEAANTKTSDGKGQWFKIGTNRWNVKSESIVYFDDLFIWID